MNPSPRPDPFVGDRLNAADLYRRHEHEVMRRVLNAMAIWLDTTKALILHQPIPHAAVALLASGGARFKTITAAGEPQPDLNAAQAAFGVWSRAVAEHIDPAIAEAFGEAFQANARTADITSLPYQLQHMETVFDRLKIWPEGAFEELRPELLEAISEAESIDQVQDRIGRILDIDAPSRRIRADINDVDKRLAEIDALIADEDTPPETFPDLRAERRELKAQRRDLWGAHDESQREWQWLARRIARTECLPADSVVRDANITAVYRRHYEGQWFEVYTASGRKIAGTPNHPVLTTAGWKGLCEVTELDHLICYALNVQSSRPTGDVDVENAPPTIGEIFDAVAAVAVVERETGTKPDFHGDGSEGYVDVLRPDWLLKVGDFAAIPQCIGDETFTPSYLRQAHAATEGCRFSRDIPVPHGMSQLPVADWDALSNQSSPNGPLVDSELHSQRLLRDARHVQRDDSGVVDVEPVHAGAPLSSFREGADLYPPLLQDSRDDISATVECVPYSGDRESRIIELDNVIRIDVSTFRGHVYNVTTVEGYYSGPHGIVTSNTQGAINAGTLAAAQAAEAEGATGHYKAWLAAHDDAVRHSHVVADGQICRLADPFTVGGFPLQFPGDPVGPGHESINCRCSLRILDEGEVQAELQGHRGGHGVAPGFARMGPDDPTQAAHAAEKVDLEDKGEVVDWPVVHDPTPVSSPPERSSTGGEFAHLSDAELDAAIVNALDDLPLYMRLDAEQQRRLNPTENAPAETEPTDEPEPEKVPKERPGAEFKGRSTADLNAELEALTLDPDAVTDWEYYDRLANETYRRDEVNAKQRERNAAKREAKRQAQIDRYMELTEQGMDHEEATEEAFGITIEQQRKDAAREQLKAWGFTGSMQEQFRKWHIDEVIRDYQQAEDDCRGHMIKREFASEFERKFKGEGYDVLWYSTEATARKYASNELLEWWDQHGRVTVEELKARLMDPSELRRMKGRRGDFLA